MFSRFLLLISMLTICTLSLHNHADAQNFIQFEALKTSVLRDRPVAHKLTAAQMADAGSEVLIYYRQLARLMVEMQIRGVSIEQIEIIQPDLSAEDLARIKSGLTALVGHLRAEGDKDRQSVLRESANILDAILAAQSQEADLASTTSREFQDLFAKFMILDMRANQILVSNRTPLRRLPDDIAAITATHEASFDNLLFLLKSEVIAQIRNGR